MSLRFLLTLPSLGLLSGCLALVGPDYEAPDIATPETFEPGEAQALSAEEIATWWKELGDEQLDALVDSVLAENLDLASAVQRVEVARASYGIQRADRLPSLNASGTYTRTGPLGLGNGFVSSSQDQWTLGANVAWEIDLFGRVRRSVESALASFQASIEDLRAAQVALAAETVATYLVVRSLQERLGIAADNVEAQLQSKKIADDRFTAGMAAGLDPAQARVNLRSTEATVPALELELQRAIHRLSVLTGTPPRSLFEELSQARSLPAMPASWRTGVPADLLRNRPDIRSLERQLAAQSAQVGVAVAALYPAINLSGNWDWIANKAGDLLSDDIEVGGIGPVVSLPIFQAGRLRSNVSVQEAALRQLDLLLRQQVLLAQEEVENALVAIARDSDRTLLLRAAAEAAQESVDLSRQLYTSGQSDFQNVLDAQRSLLSLQDQRASAQLDTLLDLVDLYRALGGGWGAHESAP